MNTLTQIRKVLAKYENFKPEESTPRVSYSQYSMWKNCARSWQFQYVEKLGKSPSNISLMGGTSFHETLQYYLDVLYADGVKKADSIDLEEYVFERLIANYKKESAVWGKKFVTKEELEEYYLDCCEILRAIRKDRATHFPFRHYHLIGCEIPIYQQILETNKTYIVGYIDVVLYDEKSDKVLIYDIKTSKKGWSKYEKDSDTKKAQVLFYKHFFSKQFGIPIEKIEVEFFIVKRKINEQAEFIQKRIQLFKPAAGCVSVKKALTDLQYFIESVYDDDGVFNGEEQVAFPGKYTCTFCAFKENCQAHQEAKQMGRL